VEQAYALGRSGVEMALAGKNAIMPTIERMSNNPYQWQIGSTDLAGVANVEKTMPLDFISDDGFGITDKCREYLYPLIQGEAYPDYDERGMPRYVVLKNELIERKLGDFKL
jgi:6-phosphofructokinase 1